MVLDYLLGDEEIDGLPMIKQLMSNFPWLKILLSSTLENTAIVRMALKIGVRGHVGKSRDLSEVVNAARRVAAGRISLSESMEKEFYLISEPCADTKSGSEGDNAPQVIEGIGRWISCLPRSLRCCDSLPVECLSCRFQRNSIVVVRRSAVRRNRP